MGLHQGAADVGRYQAGGREGTEPAGAECGEEVACAGGEGDACGWESTLGVEEPFASEAVEQWWWCARDAGVGVGGFEFVVVESGEWAGERVGESFGADIGVADVF